MITIKELIDFTRRGEDYYFYVPVFLDGYYSANNEKRIEMIKDEPDKFDDVENFYYCDVAAIAHKLANDYSLPVPNWVHKREYVLNEPYFELNTKNEFLRDYFREVSPHEFKIRNIFVDSNTLDRV